MHANPTNKAAVQALDDLHSGWLPHEGQKDALAPVISGKCDTAFISSGRKSGKTDAALYILWRYALTRPNSACYYICPDLKHGRELVWSNQRMQRFGPAKHVHKFLQNESRIVFKNGSFIKILGSENWGAANGLTPDCIVYDEFKEFHPQFHVEMNPNRLVRSAPLILIGTPPAPSARNLEQYIEYKEECEADVNKVFIRRPSSSNPHISKEWLEKEKARLFANGDEDVWFREYEAILVPGGRSAIFPMFSRESHIAPAQNLKRVAKKEGRKLDWYMGTDPATVTTFGGLIVGIHPFTKHVYIFDELYEKSQASTSVRQIFPRLESLSSKWHPNSSLQDDWFTVYDEREAWFSNEVMEQYGVYFAPTRKQLSNKDDGINLIRDLLTHELITVNSDCVNFVNEMEAYHKKDSKIIKKNDHLIDCLRYILDHANYNMVEALEKKKSNVKAPRNMVRLKDDDFFGEDETCWMLGWEKRI